MIDIQLNEEIVKIGKQRFQQSNCCVIVYYWPGCINRYVDFIFNKNFRLLL